MDDFYRDLAELLKKHKVAIVSKPDDFYESVIGFQHNFCDNYWTNRHHVTGCDVESEIKKQDHEKTKS